MKGITTSTVFLTSTEDACIRTKRRISDYGKDGWRVIKESSSVYCLAGNKAGILVEALWVPNNFYRPWKGWLPRAEVIISGNNQIKT
jgi:hypothetical protein